MDLNANIQKKPILKFLILILFISPIISGFNGYQGSINSTYPTGRAHLFRPIITSPVAAQSIEAAPNVPTNPIPANGATEISIPTTLQVTVSDQDIGNLTVTFYGRPAPETHIPAFTVIALPDTQKYTHGSPLGLGIFNIQTQWIADERSAKNIVFVSHLGDIVDDADISAQWNVADTAMGILETNGIPFGLAVGNCDMEHLGDPPDTTFFNEYFPESRFTGRPYYGGALNGDYGNNYQLFSAGGMDFIVVHLQYNLSYNSALTDEILNWADSLLKTYSSRRAIVVTHDLLNYVDTFSADGIEIYNALKDNPNLFLMLGGHLETDGRRQDLGDDGHIINSLRSDYQMQPNGGNGWLRILSFLPDENQIYVTTYSPYLHQYMTDNDNQFPLEYDMNGTSFQVIGTSTNVPSGSTASVVWPGLDVGQKYEWYVTIDDGTSITKGPIWNFTTQTSAIAPVITLHPVNLIVNAGQTASFTAAATGAPIPTVQWQESLDGSTWANISGATSAVYSFTAQSSDNNKHYQAIFTNIAGSVISNAAIITVNTAPVVTNHPNDQTVDVGNPASFTALASGNPTPTVKWQLSLDNGISWSNIPGATSTTYNITTQSSDNGNQYRAVFTNIAGSINSIPAVLTVHFPPVIVTQPINQTATAGQTVSFIASATSNPAPTVKWQSGTGESWSDIPGATSTTYNFTAQFADNGKQYRSIFTNTLGSATSSAATLTVNTIPTITLQPVNQIVEAGQTATFSANATGSPTPTVKWQVKISGGSWTDITGTNATTYSFAALAADNGNQYRAVFTNAADSVTSDPAILTVNYAPAITKQPINKEVVAGQTVSFIAEANGNPMPNAQWQVSIDNGLSWSEIIGATSPTLTLTAQPSDNLNHYRVIFTNIIGSVASETAVLTVYYAPIINQQPESKTVNAGNPVTFTAAAIGNPTPNIKWQVKVDGGSWTDIPGATLTTYSFTAQAGDNGKQYRAVFTNAISSTNSNAALLTVYFAPSVTSQPSNQSVIAGQTATFNAAANGNPAPNVKWQVYMISAWVDIPDANSTTYSLVAQLTDNGKQFRAIFSNVTGSVTTNTVTLTVSTYPMITIQPADQSVNAGQSASFTAAASGSPTPSVQWQVKPVGGEWANISGAIATTYTFTAQEADNNNQYRAVFTNLAGSANTNAVVLTVRYAPEITINPSSQTVEIGHIVTFSAAADGNPTPTVKWQVSIDNGVTWADIVGATETTYMFTTQFTDNHKQFRAVFSNSIGTSMTNAAILTFHFHTVFLPTIYK